MDTAEWEERQARLESIAAQVRACTRCRLHETATHGVPGEGPPDARIMFIGEGPGFHEDKTGRPFVGAAGQLLETLLASIGLLREDVWIANVVKHRPPENRDPLPDEIDACKPFLAQQLRIVDPELIVPLGRFAMERWLPNQKISRAHGQAFPHGRRLIVPMFHPAAALRRPEWHEALEQDFLRLPEYLDQARADRAHRADEEEAERAAAQQRLL